MEIVVFTLHFIGEWTKKTSAAVSLSRTAAGGVWWVVVENQSPKFNNDL